MRASSRTVPALVVLALVLTGCADPYAGRKTVTGTITIVGQPLNDADSMIIFEPLDGQKTSGGCKVVDGQYKLDGMDGLLPGKYLVRITSAIGGVPANDSEETAAGPGSGGGTNILSRDRVPAEWNVNSTKEVEVKAEGENKFDFAIPTQVEPKKKDSKRDPKKK
jgi:hypothetical protein